MGGIWWQDVWGNSVSNSHPSFGTQGLGGGMECYHHPIEFTSTHSNGYLLELQKQETIAVNHRSTLSFFPPL